MKTTRSRVAAASALLAALAASSSALAQFSDNFTTDSSLNAGWTLAQLNPASSYTLNASGLTLVASGTGSDLWPGTNYGASLLLQPISTSANYTVTVDLVGYSPTNDFSGAGIVLTQQTGGFTSSSSFQRIEYETNFAGNGIYEATNGTVVPEAIFPSAANTYLQLTKSGSTYTIGYSTNGSTFATATTFTDSTPYTYIGLISDRWPYDAQTGVNNVADFASFEVAAVPLPATAWLILGGLGGLAALSRNRRAA